MELISQLILTFISGGVICLIAQLLIDLTRLTPARILVCYVSVGVLIYGIGLFDPMKEIFGAGVSVPLIGFGANIAKMSHFSTFFGVLFGSLVVFMGVFGWALV